MGKPSLPSLSLPLPPPPRLRHRRPVRARRVPPLLALAAAAAMALLYLLLLAVAPCLVRGGCYRGYRSAWSFDAHAGHHPAWMAAVPDDTNLTSLSIPGTHDTMTYGLLRRDPVLNCQNWNLSVQLDAGLRYLDIRARLRDDELHIYHGDGYTGFSFADVLRDVLAFLVANPSEALVMRLKEEGRPVGANNSKTFEEAFVGYYRGGGGGSSGERQPRNNHLADHLYLYDNRSAPIPTLGALRSRVFLLQDFASSSQGAPSYGLAWDGPQMALEDAWIVPDVYHLAEKWTAIRTALERAATDALDNARLYLAHVSASIGVLPVEAAAGPLNRTVTGMNDMTGQWVRDFERVPEARRTGVVIFDFPGRQAIEAVLAWNKKLGVKV
ncbi:Phosphatidylinositol diacylglycerol-lyase [Purpureocillium takamizusanense]|uniref:Phosphatidylinositol diacylglycerol-lyase n=1 Tax=Purpureocillium takamizusanense TaxID=2060973 RepID=A0A9Q8QCV4_9HYPO|nr:Phosphatidylinositol diacylglycerol-lyase [Purpureocillium takamizusanense]UNI16649.1 Phosphatidylinositol diacylglycerol-lyase [Purpureocillium takamizusanense]